MIQHICTAIVSYLMYFLLTYVIFIIIIFRPGESLLWLSDRGDRLGDEVHTTDVRDDRG